MASITLGGNEIHTEGNLPAVGSTAPQFQLVGSDLSAINSADLAGTRVVLNIFPSIDTGVCATSVRRFNEVASGLDNTKVVCVSADLPFAAARFCAAESLENVVVASTFRSPDFGSEYGVTITDGRFAGLLARSVVVVAPDGNLYWVAQTTGMRSFTPDVPHALGIYARDGEQWRELSTLQLVGMQEGVTAGPDYLDPNAVMPTTLDGQTLWLHVEGGAGAHGEAPGEHVHRFAGQVLDRPDRTGHPGAQRGARQPIRVQGGDDRRPARRRLFDRVTDGGAAYSSPAPA